MKTLKSLSVAALLSASMIAAPAGCNSPKEKAASKTLTQTATFQQRLDAMPAEIDTAVSRLVSATSGQNPRRADDFREFSKSLTQMRESAKLVARESERAVADSNAFFSAWVREANQASAADRPAMDEAIAARCANRDKAVSYLENARRDYTKLVNSMTGVEEKLKGSLSEQTVMEVQPLVQDAIMEAQNVRNYIDRLDDSINAALSAK